jgi:uncharacterized protein
MLSGLSLVTITAAGAAAGFINALAGGGSLLSYPVLRACGLLAVPANITNTLALCPGYVGGMLAQRNDLRGQGRRLALFVPAAAVGGLLGAALLTWTDEAFFRRLVPILILAASALLAVQDYVRAWLTKRAAGRADARDGAAWAIAPIVPAAIYGGYFGAGLSVIVLAVLGLALRDSLIRLNALKQAISLSANVAAAILFLFARPDWGAAGVMAVGALIGGWLGGRLATYVKPAVLRGLVVAIGTIVGVVLLARG